MAGKQGFSEAPVHWIGIVRQGEALDLFGEVPADRRLTLAELDRPALPRTTLPRTTLPRTTLAHLRTLGQAAYVAEPRPARRS